MHTLFIGRIIQGIVTGLVGIVPILIKEISPISISGSLGAMFSFFFYVGFLTGSALPYIFSFFMQVEDYISLTFGFTIFTSLLQQVLLMTVFTNETPKYLLSVGRDDEAKQLIAQIYEEPFQDEVYHQKLRDLEADDAELVNKEKALPEDNRQAIFMAYFFSIFQQLTGINVLAIYARELAGGFLPTIKEVFPLIINSWKLVVALATIFLLRNVGRKKVMQISTPVLGVSMLGLSVAFWKREEAGDWLGILIVAVFLVFLAFFAASYGPILWIYLS